MLRPDADISEKPALEMTEDVLVVPFKVRGAKRLPTNLVPKTRQRLVRRIRCRPVLALLDEGSLESANIGAAGIAGILRDLQGC